MRSGTIAFLLGVLALQLFAVLPALHWWLCAPLALAGLRRPGTRVPAAFTLGFLWALLHAHWAMAHDWPAACAGQDVFATGTILSIPHSDRRQTRFLFRIEQLQGCPAARTPVRARLGWYGAAPGLRAGQRWRLQLRLKDRNGFFNPGGFDYERWLLQQGIGATGYVRQPAQARALGYAGDPAALLQRFRQRLYRQLEAILPARPEAALVQALALGERGGISAAQWQVLQATGTSHLVAISGLHIGLASGFGWVLGLWGWKRSAYLCRRLPAQRAAALVALLFALCYGALAGFSIPTQRALVMLAVGLTALFGQRQTAPGQAWFAALLVVLLFDPLAVLGAGFWLSFAAVAVLLYGMGGRLGPRNLWWRWGRAQGVVALGLLPLTLGAFQRLSLIGPGANLVAVPWVGLLVVPLVLASILLVGPLPALAGLLVKLACGALAAIWWLLEVLSRVPFASAAAHPGFGWLPVAGLGVAWLRAPRGFPARPLALLLLLPLWNPAGEGPGEGELALTLLDVGQGLAVVVRTRHHTLVYDSGPRFGPSFDAGHAVLVPYLRHLGIRRVDMAVLSHGDRDHTGGFEALQTGLVIDRVLAGEPVAGTAQQQCVAGARWRWDQVAFEVLHPVEPGRWAGNDRSCVLRIRAPGGTVLLTGDLQRPGERRLLAGERALRAEVLIAPHHGSATSSSPPFVDAVAPRWVLFANGYRNPYGFPQPAVVARYRMAGAHTLSTARCGAIEVAIRAAAVLKPVCSRRTRSHFWNRHRDSADIVDQ